jgi:hypothetical protein
MLLPKKLCVNVLLISCFFFSAAVASTKYSGYNDAAANSLPPPPPPPPTVSLSDAAQCISLIEQNEWRASKQHRRTLAGLVGVGWDDLLNVETVPVFIVRFKNCQVSGRK